jgi:hypothetical protein
MDTTCELPPDTWSRYFDEVGRELMNADVSIEIITAGEGRLEAADLALQALSYDGRDDVFEVSVAHGAAHLPSVLRHLVDHPQRITVDSTAMAPTRIVVDDRHGARTVVRVERPAAFVG